MSSLKEKILETQIAILEKENTQLKEQIASMEKEEDTVLEYFGFIMEAVQQILKDNNLLPLSSENLEKNGSDRDKQVSEFMELLSKLREKRLGNGIWRFGDTF